MSEAFRLDNPTLKRPERPHVSLDGDWEFMVDPRSEPDVPTEEFYSPDKEFTGTISIPGCWQAQTGTQAATSFLYNYRGIAFYKTHFAVPAGWQDRRTWLRLGGVSPAADVWVNDTYLGFTNSLRTPR